MNNDIGIIGYKKNFNEYLFKVFLNKKYKISIYTDNNELIYLNKKKYINFNIYKNIKIFIYSLKQPRKIFLNTLKLENNIDIIINKFINYLDYNDIIIDLSDTDYKNIKKRYIWLKKFNLILVDMFILNKYIYNKLISTNFIISCNKKYFKIIKEILFIDNKKIEININFYFLNDIGLSNYIKIIFDYIEFNNNNIIFDIYIILKKIFTLSNFEIIKIIKKIYTINIKNILLKINYIILFNDKKNKKNLFYNNLNTEQIKIYIIDNININNLNLSMYNDIFHYNNLLKNIIYNFKNKNIVKNKNIFINKYIKDIQNIIEYLNILLYIQNIYNIENICKINNLNIKLYKFVKILNINNYIEKKFINKIYKLSNNNKNKFNYFYIIKLIKNDINRYINSLNKIIILSIKYNIPINTILLLNIYNNFIKK